MGCGYSGASICEAAEREARGRDGADDAGKPSA